MFLGFLLSSYSCIYTLFNFIHQILRDEEGKKAGLKPKENSAVSTDTDVKMSDTEVGDSFGQSH